MDILNGKQVAALCGVAYQTFKNNKDKQLENLSKYYRWERKGSKYYIYEAIQEPFIPLKKEREEYFRRKKLTYLKVLDDIMKESSMRGSIKDFTLKTMNREEIKIFGDSMENSYSYMRKARQYKYRKGKKIWQKKNLTTGLNEPLTSFEKETFHNIIKEEFKDSAQEKMDLIDDYKNKELDEEEYKSKAMWLDIQTYERALENWSSKFPGYKLVSVNTYSELAPWEREENWIC